MCYDGVGLVLQVLDFVSGKFCVKVAVLFEDVELFELFHFMAVQELAVVVINGPHFGICQGFFLFFVFLLVLFFDLLFQVIFQRGNYFFVTARFNP